MTLADAVMITPETNLALPIAVVVILLGSIVAGVWRAANFMRDIRDGFKGLKDDMADIRDELRDTWNLSNMKDWTNSLERKNRGVGLVVPDPAAIRNGDSLHGSDGSTPPL